jgi:hypothetical protein
VSTEPDQSSTLAEEPSVEAHWAFTGDRLRALRERQELSSPLPGVLDPEPHLHVLNGRQKSGKTTFALTIAKAWCEGTSPWPGAPALPGTRTLVVSREQPVRRLESLMRRLDHYSDPANRDSWPDRVLVVARDRDLSDEANSLLCLDERGINALRKRLQDEVKAGDPIGFIVLDSLSRLKPLGVEEIDNDGMSQWLDALEQISLEFQVYVLLIHHQGHTGGGARGEARSAARGASAIGAVASVSMLLERVKGNSRQRRLSVDGSFVMEADLTFNVADESAAAGAIHYFRLTDPYAVYDPTVLIPVSGISKNELAWKVSGQTRTKGKKPPGSAGRLADQLAKKWVSEGISYISPGPHGAQIVKLKSHLASSPGSSEGNEAQSGNLSSPCVPNRHTQGEEDEDSRGANLGGVQGEDGVADDSIRLGAAPATPTQALRLETEVCDKPIEYELPSARNST